MNLAKAIRMVADAATLYDPDSEEMLEAARMVFALARDPLPVLVIHEGGCVRNALSNAPIAITVIDYDRDGVPLEELTEVPQDDGTMSLAIVEDTTVEPLDKHWANFAEWWEQHA